MRFGQRLIGHSGRACRAGAGVLAMATGPLALAEPATDVTELVMYAVNNDGNPATLLRYTFDSAEYMVVGGIVSGNKNYNDVECLTYCPQGDESGFYAAHNFEEEGGANPGQKKSRIIRIDPLTGKATALPNYVGYGYVVGMVSVEDNDGNWHIYATHWGQVNQAGGLVRNLLEINPVTGRGTVVMGLARCYEGLAADSSGQLFGVYGAESSSIVNQLWKINLPGSGGSPEELVRSLGYKGIESLEFAFGDNQKKITVPDMSPSWASNGVLMGFSDVSDKFLAINPLNGGGQSVIEYTPPFLGSFKVTDVEGIVFFTQLTDPRRPLTKGD